MAVGGAGGIVEGGLIWGDGPASGGLIFFLVSEATDGGRNGGGVGVGTGVVAALTGAIGTLAGY